VSATDHLGERLTVQEGLTASQQGRFVGPNSVQADDPVLAAITHRLATALRPKRIYLFGSRARDDAHPRSNSATQRMSRRRHPTKGNKLPASRGKCWHSWSGDYPRRSVHEHTTEAIAHPLPATPATPAKSTRHGSCSAAAERRHPGRTPVRAMAARARRLPPRVAARRPAG
jgi:hypothetical protein